MRRIIPMLILAFMLSGCACFYRPARLKADPQTKYYHQIKEWQKRQGWSEARVTEVVKECLAYWEYSFDRDIDYWQTYEESIARGFVGDCEDIAIFMMGTLRELGYPYQMRVLLERLVAGEHALLKVELPDGKWRVYQTVDMVGWQWDLHIPICEFDEKEVWVF